MPPLLPLLAAGLALAVILPVLLWIQMRAHRTRDGRTVGDVNSAALAESLRTNEILREAVARYDERLSAIESRLAQMELDPPAEVRSVSEARTSPAPRPD